MSERVSRRGLLLGGLMYASLRVGPWSIKRREQLKRLRELVAETEDNPETLLDFAARFSRRRPSADGSRVDGR